MSCTLDELSYYRKCFDIGQRTVIVVICRRENYQDDENDLEKLEQYWKPLILDAAFTIETSR